MSDRITREKQTIQKMIALYCKAHHGTRENLCSECLDLENYALDRVTHCKFGQDKPVCGNCPIHCYRPAMREKIIATMRYSGPRMILHHPVLAIYHLIDYFKKPKA
ncbi:MAG TPA: nitrous oxide-stimulated promoter family protein [Bacillota bacterium]|nr:nitrous oxide-stimulated promoter family protein [Bacillota bacterium]